MRNIVTLLGVLFVLALAMIPCSAEPFGVLSLESMMAMNPLSGPAAANLMSGPSPNPAPQPWAQPSAKRPKKDKREARGYIAPDGKK